MKNDDFEQFLASQPLRAIPSEWRAQILRTAGQRRPLERKEPAGSWWRELLWPAPMAWAGVAGAWLLIVGMHIAAQPSDGKMTMPASAASLDVSTAIMQERQFVQEFSQLEEEPAEPPRRRHPSGASNDRRTRNSTGLT